MNPFTIPARPVGDNRPLCPWETPEHDSYYVAVDNTESAYKAFQDDIKKTIDNAVLKKMVMVVGQPGCGKTALLHRCIYWMEKTLNSAMHPLGQLELIVIDLGHRASVSGLDLEARLKYVCSRVLDDLELGAIFEPDELSALERRRDNPASVYPYLSQLLRNRNKCIAVLLPEVELSDELVRYVGFVNNNIIFLAESSSENLQTTCRERFGPGSAMPVLALRVGPLSLDDGWRYVQSRISHIGNGTPGIPNVTQETIVKLMRVRLESQHPTSIRELHRVCLNVFESALANAATEIEYVNFLEYYTKQATGEA